MHRMFFFYSDTPSAARTIHVRSLELPVCPLVILITQHIVFQDALRLTCRLGVTHTNQTCVGFMSFLFHHTGDQVSQAGSQAPVRTHPASKLALAIF